MTNPFVLIICDGLGIAPNSKSNAVSIANTPNLDRFWKKYPHTFLQAAGTNVGLPHGVDGNSEVGHTTIGAGKILYQDLPRIDKAISTGEFFENEKLHKAIDIIEQNDSRLHLLGLIGSGEVHSSISHLFSLLKLIKDRGIDRDKVLLHLFTDGRDSPIKSAENVLNQVENEIIRLKIGRIASLIGRYYAMDRDERWDRTSKAYKLITDAQGHFVNTWQDAIKISYSKKIYDEMLEAYVIKDHQGEVARVEKHDSVIFFNFRSDRALQLTKAFEKENFQEFDRVEKIDCYFLGMTDYEQGYPRNIAFPQDTVINPLGKIISENNIRQLRIAESEKFPHVTYFFNGGREKIYKGEDRIEVPSPKDVATYDQKPEMSAYKITEVLKEKLLSKDYGFILVNYANPDMVAHTGILEAGIKTMEILDECLGEVWETLLEVGAQAIITADHGNIEEMIDPQTNEADTKHSINPVPFIYIKDNISSIELEGGTLADIAPIILNIMGLELPVEMEGKNLLQDLDM